MWTSSPPASPRCGAPPSSGPTARETEVDAIIFGTGFHVTDMPIAHRVVGADGMTLAEAWKDGMESLRGATAAGFPNLMTIIGPNTGLGNSSMILMIESQLNYMADYMRQLDVLGGRVALDRPAGRRAARGTARSRADAAHGVEHRRLHQLVPGRQRPQHHGLAGHHRRVPQATRQVDLAEYEVLGARPPRRPRNHRRAAGTGVDDSTEVAA